MVLLVILHFSASLYMCSFSVELQACVINLSTPFAEHSVKGFELYSKTVISLAAAFLLLGFLSLGQGSTGVRSNRTSLAKA